MIRSLAKKNLFKAGNKFLSQKNIPFTAKDAGRPSFFKSFLNPALIHAPASSSKTNYHSNEPDKRDYDALINCSDDHFWSVSNDFKLVAANHNFIKSIEESVCITLKPGDDLLIETVFPGEFLAHPVFYQKNCFVSERTKQKESQRELLKERIS